jgi:hypothetical protein
MDNGAWSQWENRDEYSWFNSRHTLSNQSREVMCLAELANLPSSNAVMVATNPMARFTAALEFPVKCCSGR